MTSFGQYVVCDCDSKEVSLASHGPLEPSHNTDAYEYMSATSHQLLLHTAQGGAAGGNHTRDGTRAPLECSAECAARAHLRDTRAHDHSTPEKTRCALTSTCSPRTVLYSVHCLHSFIRTPHLLAYSLTHLRTQRLISP